jgi:hypothetical protein
VALAGPGREQEQDFGTLVAAHRVPFVGLEMRERARPRVDLLAARANPRPPVDYEHPRVFLDLVIAELLPRLEADEDGASLVFALEDDGRAAAPGSLDLGQIPRFHGGGSLARRR